MDKKGLRSAQNSTQKSVASDQKKDVSNGARPWPGGGRGGFNRGGNGSSGSGLSTCKPEVTRSKSRHNQPQRFGGGGFGNKRPQQRGGSAYYQAGCGGGNTVATTTGLASVISDELDDSIEPELGSVFVQGTKKQNLNHLLNFHYTRDGADQRGSSRGNNAGGNGGRARNGGGKGDHGRWITTEKHKYNKEHYLQANCQFLVKADGDYTKYLNNPDTLVDWDLIEQINIQVNDVPSCPICLYPALAAKATRCGHVFCWPCILHYLALSDDHWRKCPICYEAVHKKHLKSVVMIPHATFPVNEQITFTLMKRLKGSLTAYPFDHSESHPMLSLTADKSTQFLHTVSDLRENSSIQCKLVLATSDDVLKVVASERNDLLLQKLELVSVEINPEFCFVEEAIELLNEREIELLSKKGAEVVKTLEATKERLNDINEAVFENEGIVTQGNSAAEACSGDFKSWEKEYVLEDYSPTEKNSLLEEDVDLCKEFTDIHLLEEATVEEVSEDAQIKVSGVQNGVKTFYFYQASDGQHIYLHAVNARMLEHTYGSLEFAPHIISGKILEKEGGSITEQLRNRVRYLQHLPLTCQVEVAEIDLGMPDVSAETMEVFRAQLSARQKRRSLRNRSERRREQRILEHENRQLGRCLASSPMYTPNLHLDSPNHFPTVETSVALALAETNNSNNMGFGGGGRFRSDSERSDGAAGNRGSSSRSSSPSGSVFGSVAGSSVASEGGGWWSSSLGRDSICPAERNAMLSARPSFAKMLLQSPKPKKSQSWPIPSQTKSSTNNNNNSGASTSNLQRIRIGTNEDSDAESEDYISAPAYNKSFSDAIAMALEKAAMENDAKSKNDNGFQSTGGKKKKRAKQKVLFATSMSFMGQ